MAVRGLLEVFTLKRTDAGDPFLEVDSNRQ